MKRFHGSTFRLLGADIFCLRVAWFDIARRIIPGTPSGMIATFGIIMRR